MIKQYLKTKLLQLKQFSKWALQTWKNSFQEGVEKGRKLRKERFKRR